MAKLNYFIHAKFSIILYDNLGSTKGKKYKELPEGWECLATSGKKDNDEGYFGGAFGEG
ncbi:hypothetical protein [endosymbiont of Acanthamoeba sp. UWC8]|uniref:hypothetical protein n=1 Tax=endosymbiont of Acanthamoeba sp. UWC8 TaxID=86106 RepID=UPI00130EAC0C|nr:hypothetical protein [endosymbiont of Acanthamoeba sp. UWC8]